MRGARFVQVPRLIWCMTADVSGFLAGRRVLITGASRGVGFEITKRFLSEGADVVGVAQHPERLARAAERLKLQPPGCFEPLVVDLAGIGSEHAIVEAVVKRWGALDLLVNNAAVMIKAPAGGALELEPPGALEHSLRLNLIVPQRLTVALLPLLEKGNEPRVIHLTSGAGTLASLSEGGLASYRLSKWALNGLTRIMASQWRGRVAVNALDPGWVQTDMGGLGAPGSPIESAQAALELALRPWSDSGRLFKNGAEIDF